MSDIDKRLEAILAYYAGFCSVSWDSDKVFQTEKVLKENTNVKQAIKQLMVDEFEKLLPNNITPLAGSKIDATKNQAIGYNQALKHLRQKLEEWKKYENS
jgi:tRNA A37 N6-isopentenylltransferase MiaA